MAHIKAMSFNLTIHIITVERLFQLMLDFTIN